MARQHGRNAQVYLAATSGAAATRVAFQAAWSVSVTADWREVTGFADTQRVYDTGTPEISGGFSGFLDAGTSQAYRAAADGLPRAFCLYPDAVNSPSSYFAGTVIADFTASGATGGPVTVSAAWDAEAGVQQYPLPGGLPGLLDETGAAGITDEAAGTIANEDGELGMTKISAYTALTLLSASDVLPVVDVSDTSMAASGTTKKVTVASLVGAITVSPSGDTSGVTDAASVNAAITQVTSGGPGGTVLLAPGQHYWLHDQVTVTAKFVYLRGAGRWATVVNAVGTGDTLRIYNTDTTGVLTGGGAADFTIDGTSAGAGSAGLHFGDMRGSELRLAVQNFSGSGSTGAHLDNQYAWTEECFGYLWLSNNTQNLVFDVSGNTTAGKSFGYSDFTVQIVARANQDGVVLANGALLYNSRLAIRANFAGSGSAQASAVLRITGTIPAGHPGAGQGSKITTSRLDIQAECSSSGGSNAPQTVSFGVLGTNFLTGCTGILDFTQGTLAFAVSNWTMALATSGSFNYSGPITGDSNLSGTTTGQLLAAAPSGATAETFSRGGATSICAALTNGTLHVRIIPVQAGTVVNNITFITSSTAKTGGTHGWYVLLNSALKVVAVTADQTDAATVWGTTGTYYTLPVTAPYTATYSGLYYVGVMVAMSAGTMPTFAGLPGVLSGVAGAAPVLCGLSSVSQTTPPAVGATMTAVSSSGNYQFYAYTS